MHRCRTGKRELMEKHTLHVSIIGGGIGGLAAACADASPGHRGRGLRAQSRIARDQGGLDLVGECGCRSCGNLVWPMPWPRSVLASPPLSAGPGEGNDWAAYGWAASNGGWEPPALASIALIYCDYWWARLIWRASTCMRTASASGQSKGMSSLTSPMGTSCRRTCWWVRMGCIP